jgi:hypothetical protein
MNATIGERNIVMNDLFGDLPLHEPNQDNILYKIISVKKRCTHILGIPIGTVDNRISQKVGQEIPPFRRPHIKNKNDEITKRGNKATAV